MEYLESTMKTPVTGILILPEMAWHQPQASIVTLMQLSRVMSWTRIIICNVRNWSYTIKCKGMCHILILGLKLPTTSRISIIILCMYRNFACIQWFFIGITQNAGSVAGYQFERQNKMAEWCFSRCSILSFGIISKICFICISHAFWN